MSLTQSKYKRRLKHLRIFMFIMNNSILYMNAVFWLVDERGIFYQSLFIFLNPHRRGIYPWEFPIVWYLPKQIPWQIPRWYRQIPRSWKIPSLNSLWRHGCNSNYSGFFFQPTLKKSVSRYVWDRWNVYISNLFSLFFLHVVY
jgi:hypothetical protein